MKYLKLIFIAGIIVVSDQLTKAMVSSSIPLNESITIVNGFFNLTHIHNPGGAFGFLADQNSSIRSLFFIFISFFAIGLVFYFYKKTPDTHRFLSTGFALIFGGAVGNMIDRIRFGKVVDFLDFYIGNLHWPIFNVADSMITIGVLIFVFHLLFNKIPN